jgi:hypothetical protein
MALGQQVGNLPARDHDADILQLLVQQRHGHPALIVRAQQKAHQVGPEVTGNLGRQRRDDQPALRRPVARPPVAHDPRLNDQVLDRVEFEALEAPARLRRQRHHAVLINDQPRALGRLRIPPLRATSPTGRCRWGIGALLHPTRLQVRSALQPFQPGDFIAQRRHLGLKLRHGPQQADDQRPQLRGREIFQVGQLRTDRHAAIDSQFAAKGNPPESICRACQPLTAATGF